MKKQNSPWPIILSSLTIICVLLIVSLFIFLKPNNQEDYTVDASDYIVAHS